MKTIPKPMQDSKIGKMLYVVHDLWRQTRRWQEYASSQKGLTIPQFRTIASLTNVDGIRQSEIGENTDTDPMTVSGIIERLETKGYVRREVDPTDSRAKLVYVTDVGRDVVSEVRAEALAREPVIFEDVSDAEFEVTLSVLKRISENLVKAHPQSKGTQE